MQVQIVGISVRYFEIICFNFGLFVFLQSSVIRNSVMQISLAVSTHRNQTICSRTTVQKKSKKEQDSKRVHKSIKYIHSFVRMLSTRTQYSLIIVIEQIVSTLKTFMITANDAGRKAFAAIKTYRYTSRSVFFIHFI